MANKVINSVLPPAPRTGDRQALQFFSAIKQALDELRNNFVISDQGIVARRGSDAATDIITAGSETDLTAFSTPSAPTNVQATGAIENVVVEWSYSGAPIGKFEIWRSLTDDLGQAELRGVTEALVFLDAVGPSATFYYWVRGVSTGGVEGPFQAVNGVEGSTSDDPLSEIINASAGLPLAEVQAALGTQGFGMIDTALGDKAFAVLADRFSVFDGTDGAVVPFQVVNGEVFINTAVIADASISSAKIASLAADKITATDLSAISANLGSITAGSLAGPNDRFKIDLANNRLEVYDDSGTLRVRIGDI